MHEQTGKVNTLAPLTNVALCLSAMTRAMDAPAHLPRMVCFYGPSGYGKTTAATYTVNKYRAYRVECRSSWTRKALLDNILKEMGISPAKTIYGMTDQACEQLVLSGRPLIVDEMDHLVDKNAVEIVRDLYEGAGGLVPILLIGEERLPAKLKQWERFHGRILDFIPAQPADMEDACHLRTLYCNRVSVADDLLGHIHRLAKGSVRRICVNLERVQEEGMAHGVSTVDMAFWGKRELYTGEAPQRRV